MDYITRMNVAELLGNAVADGVILYEHKKELDKVGAELVNKYGKGGGNGLDDYYHALSQCLLGKMSDRDSDIGLFLGEVKEDVYDRYRKSSSMTGDLSEEEFNKDKYKDLQNNDEGAILGKENRDNNISCRILLDHKRPRNMRNENIR